MPTRRQRDGPRVVQTCVRENRSGLEPVPSGQLPELRLARSRCEQTTRRLVRQAADGRADFLVLDLAWVASTDVPKTDMAVLATRRNEVAGDERDCGDVPVPGLNRPQESPGARSDREEMNLVNLLADRGCQHRAAGTERHAHDRPFSQVRVSDRTTLRVPKTDDPVAAP